MYKECLSINKKLTPNKVTLFSSLLALTFISISSLFISLFFVNKKNEFIITGITFLLLFSAALAISAYNLPFRNEQKEKNNSSIISSYLITTVLFTSSTVLLSLFFITKPINSTLVSVDIPLILLASLSLATTLYLFGKQEKDLQTTSQKQPHNPPPSAPNLNSLDSQSPCSDLQQDNNCIPSATAKNLDSPPPPYQQAI